MLFLNNEFLPKLLISTSKQGGKKAHPVLFLPGEMTKLLIPSPPHHSHAYRMNEVSDTPIPVMYFTLASIPSGGVVPKDLCKLPIPLYLEVRPLHVHQDHFPFVPSRGACLVPPLCFKLLVYSLEWLPAFCSAIQTQPILQNPFQKLGFLRTVSPDIPTTTGPP